MYTKWLIYRSPIFDFIRIVERNFSYLSGGVAYGDYRVITLGLDGVE